MPTMAQLGAHRLVVAGTQLFGEGAHELLRARGLQQAPSGMLRRTEPEPDAAMPMFGKQLVFGNGVEFGKRLLQRP
jgi:hypothetical protein